MFRGTCYDWRNVNKGTTQGSASGPYIFNLFINDLEIENSSHTHLIKYADDSSLSVEFTTSDLDESSNVIKQYMAWSCSNYMPCNLTKCKELILREKCYVESLDPIYHICQAEYLKLLGITFQSNCRILEHIKLKLVEANKCVFVIRNLRNEGYNQTEIDHIFNTIVLPKITYGLSIYAASPPELTIVQQFFHRCFKRGHKSKSLDIYNLLEIYDYSIFNRISKQAVHPLRDLNVVCCVGRVEIQIEI